MNRLTHQSGRRLLLFPAVKNAELPLSGSLQLGNYFNRREAVRPSVRRA